MATIYDIARRTNLAISTVAACLNDRRGYSAKTKLRVREAASEAGYRPSFLSKALAGARSMTIGIICDSVCPLTLWNAHAIERSGLEAGYHSYVLFLDGALYKGPADALHGLLDRRVDGVVVYSLEPLIGMVGDALARATIPVVYMRAAPQGVGAAARHFVAIRREAALRRLAIHLRELGHRSVVDLRLGTIASLYDQYDHAFAAEGVRLVAGLPWRPGPCDEPSEQARAIYQLVRRQIVAGDVPTAISMADDEFALAVMAAIRDAGLRTPQDISVIGKDGHLASEFAFPPLTTIREPGPEAGAAAFGILQQLMQNREADIVAPAFEAELIVRASTGPCRAA